MLDVVVVDGVAKGIVCRNLITGKIQSYSGDAVVLATGGYSNVFFLSTNAKGCNVTAAYRAHRGEHCSQIPASRRSIQPVFHPQAITSPN